MRIKLALALMVAGVAVARSASATHFVVDLVSTPDVLERGGYILGISSSETFPNILVTYTDDFTINVSFGETLNGDLGKLRPDDTFIGMNVPNYSETHGLRLVYDTLNVIPTNTGFQMSGFTYQDFGTPIVGNGFNLNAIYYVFSEAPEPAAWAMMLTGFGMMGVRLRRQRRRRDAHLLAGGEKRSTSEVSRCMPTGSGTWVGRRARGAIA